ncbi:hypothetical protein TH53_08385 [Pedobacter lusitanus]|uniref:D-isomer specific 2-hydroxyacid dehydrogenase NAD-binding domain-containing protein n=1 Tax=Pedobacter lusitanus TaxID=1503925 RepID=A0A0D0F7L8_9SPHI|nr:glyoxylate/hydroxypyruvate reductase A [Pedobacter lusitanus]KIO77648.1 hypothetical protein TH53_08385 [Pedobacter lusitanus]
MSIVIIFNNKDPKPWAEALEKFLPEDKVFVYPNVPDPQSVLLAICWKPVPGVLSEFPNLRLVQSAGAAVDHLIRTQSFRETMLLARIVDENLSNDMWEYLLAGSMSMIRTFSTYESNQEEKRWEQLSYSTIGQTTIAVLGLGKIGAATARKLSVLGFSVRGWSATKKEIEGVNCYYGNEQLDLTLTGADILINILPLTPETENILNTKNLLKLNKGAGLINVARGEHLVEDDLLDLLASGHLSAARLDVFREEPLPKDHPFWEQKKIGITPHIASLTNINSAINQVVQNYRNLKDGKEVRNLVSIQKGY